jgi:hypothetical protein
MVCANSSTPRPELFWPKIQWSKDGCWEWRASRHRNGYGQFHLPGGKTITAHRAGWVLLYGPIPGGMVVMHTCDNRACVRPDHLRLGTQAENMQDMHAKGRTRRLALKPTCGKGHRDWYTPPSGPRQCRACQREWAQAQRVRG